MRLARLWLGIVVALALLAPWLAQNGPRDPVASALAAPARGLPFGADALGRDFLARMLVGTRLSLGLAGLAAAIAIGAGGAAGFAGAMLGSTADRLWLWTTNVLLSIPSLLLAMLLVAAWGPGIPAVVAAVGIGGAPVFSRVTRTVVLQLLGAGYVAAARAAGGGRLWTSLRHVLPNALPQLAPLAGTQFGWAFLGTTTLTFLGLAGDPALPEWGAMLNAGRVTLVSAPRLVLIPALAICLTILSVHALTAPSEIENTAR
ncbi:MAG TPA: ABC transporter permease subunit [Anaerolineales bacterium]